MMTPRLLQTQKVQDGTLMTTWCNISAAGWLCSAKDDPNLSFKQAVAGYIGIVSKGVSGISDPH